MPPIPNLYYVSFATPGRWLGSCLVLAMSPERAAEVTVESGITPESPVPIDILIQMVPPDEIVNPADCYRLITDRSEVERLVGECLLG